MLQARPQTKLDEFLPHVMAMVMGDTRPGLPSSVVLSYIRKSAIDFAKKSSVIRRTERIKLQAGLYQYPLVSDPIDERIYRLVRVYDDNGNEVCASFDDQTVILQGHGYVSSDACEDVYLNVEFVVIPTQKACGVDSILYDEWHDAIVSGALSSIHLMPQRPWTSGTASREQARLQSLAIGEARRKYFTDRAGTCPTRVRPPSDVYGRC